MAKRKKTTAYQRLQKAKAAHCAGKKTKTQVKSVASAYIKNAVTKAKSAAKKLKNSTSASIAKAAKKAKTKATASANRVLRKGCNAKVSGTKKRKTTRRKKRK